MPEVFPLTARIAGSGKTKPFEKRHAGCEEREKINRRRIYDTLRINFFEATKQTACIFSKGEETGVNYYGARYLDPKYSRWLSGDPALGDYVPAAGTDPSKLAGMGGVYNTVNLHLYHYSGNNPVKYTDPDGKAAMQLSFKELFKFAVKKAAPKAAFAAVDGPLLIAEIIIGIWTIYDIYQLTKTLTDEAESSRNIPEEDKDAIAQHAHDDGHGPEINLEDPSEEGIKEKMDEILNDPNTKVGTRKKDGATGYLGSDGTLIIHNPSVEDKGTVFVPDDPEGYFNREFPIQ